MLNIIAEIILNIGNDTDELDYWEASNKILDTIEIKGMLPPFNHDEYYRTWRDGGSGYKWENEE